MKTTIEYILAHKIAYFRNIGAYGSENVQTMETLKIWAKDNKLLNDDSTIYGIAQDDPNITKEKDCRYDTGIVVINDININDSRINIGQIAGGKYSVFEYEHTKEEVEKAWKDIFVYLEQNKFTIDNSRHILERYKAKLVLNHLCEICVPVK